MTQTIVIENRSASLSAGDLARYIPIWQYQLNNHVRAFWTDLPVFNLVAGTIAGSGAWGAVFEDTTSQAGDLGYHDKETGMPVARVDVQAALADGYDISAVGSHEFVEMACDPNMTNIIDGSWGQVLGEACDAFIMPPMQYDLNGVKLSNFVTPGYFDPSKRSPRLDMKGMLTADQAFPYLPPGGYALVIPPNQSSWGTVRAPFAADEALEAIAAHRAELSQRHQAFLAAHNA